MQYRRMGASGVKLSVLSFGSWVTFGKQLDLDDSLACMQAARDAGVNFFDNAEAYAAGEAERQMGKALAELGWPRWSYLVSTKFFWGIHEGPNTRNTLNRKYLMEGIDASLERFGLDHVDLVYCHRPDPETPIEETVWAMSEIVSSGRAHYWGTSEWSAAEILSAYEVAVRDHLHRPRVEQPQYNLFARSRVEEEYAPLYEDIGLGTTTFSPLASGFLSGKYLDGVPEGSRADTTRLLEGRLSDEEAVDQVRRLADVAADIDCSLAQLALAWCGSNPHVTSVITGASRVSQVEENMQALDVMDALTDEVKDRIESIFA
ncbi:MAG TPA: aldo/keto reductase [Acidimicrobiia bacterium]|nr:aldo/keto reductase [Acidimicrobiia bacterium]